MGHGFLLVYFVRRSGWFLTLGPFFIMDTGKTLLTFLAGAAVGAMTALLLAPDSGDKTRGRLRTKATGAADMAKAKILEGLDAIEAALQEE